jgi:hypothetical protein
MRFKSLKHFPPLIPRMIWSARGRRNCHNWMSLEAEVSEYLMTSARTVVLIPAQNNNERIVRISLEDERSPVVVYTAGRIKKGSDSRPEIIEHALRKLLESHCCSESNYRFHCHVTSKRNLLINTVRVNHSQVRLALRYLIKTRGT